VVLDSQDQPVRTLEKFTKSNDGQSWEQSPAEIDPATRMYEPPSDEVFYRFRREPLGQPRGDDAVDGVLMDERKLVMRSASMIVVALLGQADALDPYAIDAQRAESDSKILANRRDEIALEALTEIRKPEDRARAYDDKFKPETVLANRHPS
jgi:hypothetical protein